MPTASDFIQPEGRLREAGFPEIDLGVYLGAWLEEARGKTDDKEARAAWVYHRAYDWKAGWWRDQAESSSASGAYSETLDPLAKARQYDSKAAKQKEFFDELTATADANQNLISDEKETVYVL